jgi:hypothetical protein
MRLKGKDLCFCFIPAMVGVLMIFFTVLGAFNNNASLAKELLWIFLWLFLSLVLISYTVISYLSLCKKEGIIKQCK